MPFGASILRCRSGASARGLPPCPGGGKRGRRSSIRPTRPSRTGGTSLPIRAPSPVYLRYRDAHGRPPCFSASSRPGNAAPVVPERSTEGDSALRQRVCGMEWTPAAAGPPRGSPAYSSARRTKCSLLPSGPDIGAVVVPPEVAQAGRPFVLGARGHRRGVGGIHRGPGRRGEGRHPAVAPAGRFLVVRPSHPEPRGFARPLPRRGSRAVPVRVPVRRPPTHRSRDFARGGAARATVKATDAAFGWRRGFRLGKMPVLGIVGAGVRCGSRADVPGRRWRRG